VKRRLGLLAVAFLSAAAIIVVSVIVSRDDEAATRAQPAPALLARCANMLRDRAQDCFTREARLLMDEADDPHATLAAITRTVSRIGGTTLADCHGLMHGVGRHYAAEHGVTVATLMRNLPKTNDPGCSAGFAHGLVTGVAGQIDTKRPRSAAAVCGRAGTRYQRYSCVHGFGHAFMRIYDDRLAPALRLCRSLGPRAAPDCAQGAFHDYWFAVLGADDAPRPAEIVTSPRALCGAQQPEFVRPCWYRAFIDRRPEGFQTEAPSDFDDLCAGLAGVQRAGCVTAASVIGPVDPAAQLALCAGLREEDAVSCIHGTKVQNLLDRPLATYVGLIRGCDGFAGPTRLECYRWLGTTLSVITDGAFGRDGCARLAADAGKACSAGARRMEDPLVTFS
jgi:hypothetical protein